MAAKRKFVIEFYGSPGKCLKRNFAATRTTAIKATVGHFLDKSYPAAKVAKIFHIDEFGLQCYICTVMRGDGKLIITNL